MTMSQLRRCVRRDAIALLRRIRVISVVWAFALPIAAQSSDEVRRVVIVHFDTTRVDDFGCYGTFVQTPAIDALARQGLRYTNAVTCSPYTSPSVATCLTGFYPSNHGVRTIGLRLDPALTTVAERFSQHGFVTGGFTSNAVLLKTPHMKHALGFEQGFDVWFGIEDPQTRAKTNAATSPAPACQTITEEAIKFVRQHRSDKFFLWMLHFDPHVPYDPPAPYDTMYADEPALVANTVKLEGEPWERTAYNQSHEYVARHKGEVTLTDHWLARLVDELDRLEGNTLYVILADHGESFGDDNQWFNHGQNIRHPSMNVPLIMCCPGVVPVGTRDALVDNTDVLPTVLELAGIPFDATSIDGRSLVPTFAADDPWPDRMVPMATLWHEEQRLDRYIGVRSKFYSLQCSYDRTSGQRATARLYDHRLDPAESRDIKDEFPVAFEEHLRFLDNSQHPANPILVEQPEVEPEMRERLQTLGYLE